MRLTAMLPLRLFAFILIYLDRQGLSAAVHM